MGKLDHAAKKWVGKKSRPSGFSRRLSWIHGLHFLGQEVAAPFHEMGSQRSDVGEDLAVEPRFPRARDELGDVVGVETFARLAVGCAQSFVENADIGF